jgi:hypothetical protein
MMNLSDAYGRFSELLKLAEERSAAGDPLSAVRLCQIAARYAYPGHVGLFGSPRLERLLLEIGKQIPTPPSHGASHRAAHRRNVLHVLSYAQPIGGDSRFAWRWIQEDPTSRHSVAITTQADLNGRYDVPEILRKSAQSTGGFVRLINAPTSQPLDQARELRALCQDMDIVALHVYPYDVVPVLALAAGCDSAKTLLVNHADHTFWLGGSVAHCVVHLRKQQTDFLRDRRGLRPEQSAMLPTPLAYSPPTVARAQAKRALGVEPNVVLLLTIATPFKYGAPGQIGLLDLVAPVLAKTPQALLVAVGPKPEGAWQSAGTATEGRIVALGKRWDTDHLYAAADVYLDSVPFSSITSLLEAGSRGVPLLGYRHPDRELALLGPGAPGLDDAVELPHDPESYRRLLTRLIVDAEFRHQSGNRVQAQILTFHTGSNWRRALHNAYEQAERSDGRGCLRASTDTFQASALNLALLHLYGREPFGGVRALIRDYLGTLTFRSRLSITWHLQRKGLGLCLWNLLPPPIDKIVRIFGRWAKTVRRGPLRPREGVLSPLGGATSHGSQQCDRMI